MKGIYYPIAQHLQQFCPEGSFVIWRDAFRWKRHCPEKGEHPNSWETYDEVLPNHYSGFELDFLAPEFGYKINHDFNLCHVAIVSKK